MQLDNVLITGKHGFLFGGGYSAVYTKEFNNPIKHNLGGGVIKL